MSLPRNMLVPAVVLMAGWYGGAQYGMPDYVKNTINGTISQGVDMVGGLLGGGEEGAEAEDGVGSGGG